MILSGNALTEGTKLKWSHHNGPKHNITNSLVRVYTHTARRWEKTWEKGSQLQTGETGLEDSPQPSKETSLVNNLIAASFQENSGKSRCCCPHGGTVVQLP